MFKKLLFYFLFSTVLYGWSGYCQSDEIKVLVFTKTAGFEHQSIPAGTEALLKLGKTNGIGMDTTADASKFTEDNLKKYNAVVFLSTTGDILNAQQQEAFEHYIRTGGGFFGIHAAADAENDWPWYGKLVGGYFDDHPKVQKATIDVINTDHPSTAHLTKQWERTDEWYNYKSLNPEINVLATLNEKTYEGGKHGDYHPIIWYHNYDGGRAFYTGGGHLKENFKEPAFLEHLLNAILWAAGEDLD
jgi:type 1 glutamine amidotransferase